MIWLALVPFTDPDVCFEYVQKNNLMQQLDWQCILIEPDEPTKPLAPEYSLKPKARP